jgi:UDP-glucose 4-epimerase
MAYQQNKGVPVVIVRYFNTIGPRQTGRYGMVVPRFVQQALAGEAITVYGDGKQSRSFTDVADAVRATLALSRHPAAAGAVFNIGNEHEITIDELAHRVKALTGSASDIVRIPYERAYSEGFEDLRRRVPDTTKLRNLTGFSPEYALDATLHKVIRAYRGQPQA